MNEFLELVKERHDPSIDKKHPICPYCSSKNVDVKTGSMTLVGLMSNGGDPNHHWDYAHCNNCDKKFNVEWKQYTEGNQYDPKNKNIQDHIWLVEPETKKILAGIPGCYENYVYTCKHCNGNVHKKYYNLNSSVETSILTTTADENGNWINHYDIIFECDKCETKIKSSNSHFSRHKPIKRTTPYPNKLRFGWKIIEEVGIGWVNEEAIKRIKL